MARVTLPRHECETRHPDLERIRHRRELRVVREVGLEEVLGLGITSDFRGGRVGRMRDLSLSGGAGQPR
jgi:hypothetical protein